MPGERLKKSDLVVVSRVPGFEDELRSSSLRLTRSGLAWYQRAWFRSPGGVPASERAKHVFNDSALRRIRSLLEGLPLPGPPRVILDDFASLEAGGECWRT